MAIATSQIVTPPQEAIPIPQSHAPLTLTDPPPWQRGGGTALWASGTKGG
jgi:hypothetical protein